MKQRIRKAFTLIEVLIVMVLVTILITSGIYMFKIALSEIQRAKVGSIDKVLYFSQLDNLINDTMFYSVKGAMQRFGVSTVKYFIKKNETEFIFISRSPLLKEEPSVIRLSFENDNLIYQESPLYNKKQNYKNPTILDEAKKIIILKGIKKGKFIYEKAKNLPAEYDIEIPKIVKISWSENDESYSWIFTVKYDYYKLKSLISGMGGVF